ncbi:uncharacterized protein LOC101854740 [Aplysia californica]|uniref:Uncharacterized protein LOC101854740 n=1 Tax=Aplysia californica TaxID=6500 RepID=A0ABM0K0G1_APLCA|nr:uncharacterized protein LOC101854740 [Aplysia californica]
MSNQRDHHPSYSPLRAKRRQSDAKWRASVATCYDTLKYVVPNMKQMSRRKISKALILQETEKHIKELEDKINQLVDVECPSKGKALLWQDGLHWTSCSLDKLRTDFSGQQRKIFQSSSQGRRCYKLLHDIKEEVFSMSADPKRLAFVEENVSISSLINNSRLTKEPHQTTGLHLHLGHKQLELDDFADEGGETGQQGFVKLFRGDLGLEVGRTSFSSASLSAQEQDTLAAEYRNPSTVCADCVPTDFSTVKVEYCHGEQQDYAVGFPKLELESEQEVPFHPTPVKATDSKRSHDYDNSNKQRELDLSVSDCAVVPNFDRNSNLHDPQTPPGIHVFNLKAQTFDSSIVDESKQELHGNNTATNLNVPVKQSEGNFVTPKRDVSALKTWPVSKSLFKTENAKNKLNFSTPACNTMNSPPWSGGLKSPEHTEPSPMISGFTPIKVPEMKPNVTEDNPLTSFISPWKTQSSSFDSRIPQENYLDHHDLEDSLLCFETLDTMDLEDNASKELTPANKSRLDKTQEPDVSFKAKRSPNSSMEVSQPKCRKRLERLYEQDTEYDEQDEQDNQTVPQLGSSLASRKEKTTDDFVVGTSDFDGFFYYYRQVGPKLNEKLGSHSLHSPTVAFNVAHMWTDLPQHEKNTMSALASLEGQSHAENIKFGQLSQDLENVEIKPLDPQDFIPDHLL